MLKAKKIITICGLIIAGLFIASAIYWYNTYSTLSIIFYGITGFLLIASFIALTYVNGKIRKANQ